MKKAKFYSVKNNKIIINNNDYFCIKDICECGQLFRYKNYDNVWHIYSKDKMCKVVSFDNYSVIETEDIDYFINYFDLDTDYESIIHTLDSISSNGFLKDAMNKGKGIRILKQDAFEIIISFILSANNNIKRIQSIIERMCEKFGTNMGNYFAFPSQKQLCCALESDLKNIGAGYRSAYIVKTLKQLTNIKFEDLHNYTFDSLKAFLLSLNGVGEKVCDCILLFGFSRFSTFPVDTWIEKIYNEHLFSNKKTTNRTAIHNKLIEIFGELSGYAQQYMFNYKRNIF